MTDTPSWPKLGQLTDKFGNTFHIGNAGDFWMPPFPLGEDADYRTHVRRIRDMEIRDDDVLCISPMKTGMHWHRDIILMLRNKDSKYRSEQNSTVEFIDMVPMETVDKMDSPRLLNTHMPFRYCPRQALEKKVKVLFLDRNPKDAMVSLYSHMTKHKPPMNYSGSFEHFFRLLFDVGYFYGDTFDYLMDWQEGMEAHPDVPYYKSVYEDMKQDPIQGVINLNNFLGTGCSPELCAEIADACTFDKMQSARGAMPQQEKAIFKDGKSTFYRKGEVGDWHNWFTKEMDDEY